jgi:hypothetical protein
MDTIQREDTDISLLKALLLRLFINIEFEFHGM